MTAVLKILVLARSIISEPAHWNQGHLALTEDGDRISTLSSMAVCFCAFGAVHKAAFEFEALDSLPEAIEALVVAISESKGMPELSSSLVGYNDNHSHEEVLQRFDEAIEKSNVN